MWKLTDVVDHLAHLTYSVTRAILDPKWKEKWQGFSDSFEQFKEMYIRIHPPKRGLRLLSPKLYNILVHLVPYIEEHQHSLHRCHEQAFETFHSKFKAFEQKFKIPKVTWWVPPPSTSSSSAEEIDKDAPSYSTRSCDQPKRQKTSARTKREEK